MIRIIKLALFIGAVGWALINIAGIPMALASGGSAAHLAVHVVLAVVFSGAAWLLRPRFGRSAPVAHASGDARVDVLEDEVSDLQRQIDEAQRGLEFTEQLLKQRPQSQPVDRPKTEGF